MRRQHSINEWLGYYYERIVPVPQSLISTEWVEGVDISRWNVYFTPETSAHKIDFAFQKLTEGVSWIDPKVDELWNGVKQIAVRGGYHYMRSGQSWAAQVNNFLSVFNTHDYHVAIADLESNNGDNVVNDTLFADTRRWIDGVRLATKKKVVLYTNLSTYTLFAAGIKRLYPDGQTWLANLDFWIAYPSLTATEPPLPSGRTWTLWQYRWDGKGYGTDKVDVNRFNGSLQQLYTWAGVTGEPEPPPEPTGNYKGTVTATRLNFRPAPNTNNSPYYSMPSGTKVEADSVVNGWWHIIKVNGQTVQQETYAYEGDAQGYIKTDESPGIPPPDESPAYLIGYDKNNVEIARYNKQ
jgi:GH25 family lysozyme M1 (1,4-beta-N-acetylmuramidase)